MGATFPALLALARSIDGDRRVIARIYAVNVLGAAGGAFACGFLLLRSLGVYGTTGFAAALNVLAALCCAGSVGLRAAPDPIAVRGAEDAPREDRSLLAVAFVSGALTLTMEIVWMRLASFFIGNRTFAFATVLGCTLLLLAGGAAIADRLLRRGGSPRALLSASCWSRRPGPPCRRGPRSCGSASREPSRRNSRPRRARSSPSGHSKPSS